MVKGGDDGKKGGGRRNENMDGKNKKKGDNRTCPGNEKRDWEKPESSEKTKTRVEAEQAKKEVEFAILLSM